MAAAIPPKAFARKAIKNRLDSTQTRSTSTSSFFPTCKYSYVIFMYLLDMYTKLYFQF